ncbi:hypothetical protein EMIHUDRAFT_97960 [Emiliania huxleyi CCMP1516]|uniref:Prolyl 4-hydroxylase alpha subunit domain-containing protein n=2 Tax=Emiliania huxleyi TaxID=2903 RepID=A0A0D3KQN4_EMIH1|nr:hypothetical protein EMIHUDRAFT_97960 [Emiliania huxleyi CCMP1516]EOD38069.1 hypothetical protein EMIHUDRAFT_97960 [Emiliania huxleyi CCMP1516]|eukprot:XP_005790498.1 hypothetical protein EMIHUDRAFT_97960 [Emiliania huxleyi CCMP1516]
MRPRDYAVVTLALTICVHALPDFRPVEKREEVNSKIFPTNAVADADADQGEKHERYLPTAKATKPKAHQAFGKVPAVRGTPCSAACEGDPSAEACASCCRSAPHEIDWHCGGDQPVGCCLGEWKEACWDVGSDENNGHACNQCGPARPACSVSNPCASDAFCNFDNGDSGFCEACSDCTSAGSTCDTCGLPAAGASDCNSACEPASSRPTATCVSSICSCECTLHATAILDPDEFFTDNFAECLEEFLAAPVCDPNQKKSKACGNGRRLEAGDYTLSLGQALAAVEELGGDLNATATHKFALLREEQCDRLAAFADEEEREGHAHLPRLKLAELVGEDGARQLFAFFKDHTEGARITNIFIRKMRSDVGTHLKLHKDTDTNILKVYLGGEFEGGESIGVNEQSGLQVFPSTKGSGLGGRASSALISNDKASLRAVFRGGSVVDGCGTAAQPALRRCLRLFAAGGLLRAEMAKNSSRRTPRAYALARCEAHAPRCQEGRGHV